LVTKINARSTGSERVKTTRHECIYEKKKKEGNTQAETEGKKRGKKAFGPAALLTRQEGKATDSLQGKNPGTSEKHAEQRTNLPVETQGGRILGREN